MNLEYFFSTFYVKCRVSTPYYAVLLFKFDLTQNLAYSRLDTLWLFLIVVKENNTKKTKDEFKTNFIEEIQFIYNWDPGQQNL